MAPKRKRNSDANANCCPITIEIKEIITSSRGKPHLVDKSNHRYAHYSIFSFALFLALFILVINPKTEAQVKTKQVKCVQPKSQMVKNHKLSSHAMLAKKY